MTSDSKAAIAPIFLLCAIPLALLAWRFDFVCDDAFISFRYSNHFADGLGLRFNRGVDPPVEGYTNLLWVLWCSIPERFNLDTGVFARVSLVACSLTLLLALLRVLALRVGLREPALLGFGLVYASLPPVGLWTTSGLETMAFATALFVAFERLAFDPHRPRVAQAALAIAAACLLRSDGFVWSGMLCIALFGGGYLGQRRELRRSALLLAGAVVLVAGTHIAWRLGYHGDWVPNTARAKVGFGAIAFERGSKYVLSWLAHFPVIPLAFGIGLARLVRVRDPLTVASLLFCTAGFAYVVAVGGDFLPMGRFLLPVVPFAVVALATAFEGCGTARVSLAIATAVASVASILPAWERTLVPASVLDRTHYNWNFNERLSEVELWRGEVRRAAVWSDLGRALALHSEEGDSLIAASVGAIGYHSGLFLFDQYGLVSREVALLPMEEGTRRSAGHDKYVDLAYFEKDRPTFMHARLIEVDGNGEPLKRPPGNRREPRYDQELIPLSVEDGFPPNTALQVGRMKLGAEQD